MKIDIPRKDELEKVNNIAKQIHNMHVNWRPDIFVYVEDVIPKDVFYELIENNEICVIRDNDTIVGYATFSISEKNTHGLCYRKYLKLNAICIDENYRKKGTGTELINHIIEIGKKNNCTDLYLTVNEENTNAIKFYEKLGMKVKNIAYSMKF